MAKLGDCFDGPVTIGAAREAADYRATGTAVLHLTKAGPPRRISQRRPTAPPATRVLHRLGALTLKKQAHPNRAG
jgi:hypothetical protein